MNSIAFGPPPAELIGPGDQLLARVSISSVSAST